MASSASSSHSVHAPPIESPSPEEFRELPIKSLRRKIVEKIMENRVTLIVGETGCGKSSQVPQYLLEANMEPILCTQPRRFAVVAVARMVAEARNSEVGAEVGYHIGRSKVASASSKIMFKTAGVLLEEMRDKGMKALNYKVIILDEVHERSAESDLVLVCVKQFLLKNNDLRVVLMSATADIARYKDYFKDLGRGERVEVLAIPSSSQHVIYQRKVSYLEQVASLLGISPSESLSSTYCSGPSPHLASAVIKPEVHKLIHELVVHIHKNEPDMEKSILVFLPTYHALEQQWFLLKPFRAQFKVHILHSSIDTEQALMAMRISRSHRKVILATNIAESSVTIPKVAFVIDSCRSLHVHWNADRKADTSVVSWVSKSQAEQRRGRTGRTCDGQVYRLVPGSFYSKLVDFECPAILRLSLRQQVLLICCAGSKVISDPKVLLQKALDPPDADVVKDALDLLHHIGALERTPRGRFEPTFYGRMLASFSLSFEASMLILKFGDFGMLREGILLGVLMDTQPLPILRPFGQEHLSVEYNDQYYSGDSGITNARREVSLMANLCAYQFWQRVYKDNRRLERLRQLSDTGAESVLVPQLEEEWCLFHNVVQSSLHHVAEAYEDVLDSIHRFRPEFLSSSDGLPVYYEPYEFQHRCQQSEETGRPAIYDDPYELFSEKRKCISVPFVPSNNFQSDVVAEKLATIIKLIRTQCVESASSANQHAYANGYAPQVYGDTPVCKFFVQGLCNWGSECRFSHSLEAKKPPCMFVFTLKGCRNGDSCLFSHELDQSKAPIYQPSLCSPEDDFAYDSSLLRQLPTSSDELMLLLDDVDFQLSSHLCKYYDPSQIIATTCRSDDSIHDNPPPPGVKVLWGDSQPCQTIDSRAGGNPIPWSKVKCVLWSLNFDRDGENTEAEKLLVRTFFESLATRILTDGFLDMQVILNMNNIRFCQLQVEKWARESFFFLRESFPFDESSFGKLSDSVSWSRPMVASRPISYVFDCNPPRADYASVLHKFADFHL